MNSNLALTLICGVCLLVSGCASEMTEFERQNQWLENNYPNAKQNKQKKSQTATTNEKNDTFQSP